LTRAFDRHRVIGRILGLFLGHEKSCPLFVDPLPVDVALEVLWPMRAERPRQLADVVTAQRVIVGRRTREAELDQRPIVGVEPATLRLRDHPSQRGTRHVVGQESFQVDRAPGDGESAAVRLFCDARSNVVDSMRWVARCHQQDRCRELHVSTSGN
jgi:hypothetical protein